MTLEEYRIQVIEKLKACRDPVKVRGLLAEVDLVVMNGRITDHAQKTFDLRDFEIGSNLVRNLQARPQSAHKAE